jgi:hypothetical protein
MANCPHCGEAHPPESKFCPATGQPLQPPAATERVKPLGEQKGVVDLFKEAGELYQKHARTFLITAALLFVPGALISSCTATVMMGTTMVAAPAAQEAAERMARRSEEVSRRVQEAARRGQNDQAAREAAREMEELERDARQLGVAAVGGAAAFFMGLLAFAITALVLYGLLLPLTQGALTIAVADALLGGGGDWRQHWGMLFKRLGLLITALLPAAGLFVLGCVFLFLPGIILGFLFTFVPAVVLVEGVGGLAALKRSMQLVRADWLRVALVLIVNFIVSALAHWVGRIFVPRSAIFFSNFVGDLLWLVVLPVPIISSVLLYFDVRRKVDGLDDEHFRAELETLRPPMV